MPVILLVIGIIGLYAWVNPGFFSSVSADSFFVAPESSNKIVQATISPPRDVPAKQDNNVSVPAVGAISVGVYDVKSDFKLWSLNDSSPYPIASITKLMSAMVFLDQTPNLEEIIEVKESDYRGGGRAHFFVGDKVRVSDIFKTALVASDNTAVALLVRSSGLTEEEFVAKMNEKASLMRLKQTTFVDPTGLDSGNQSTVREVAKLAEAAMSYEEIKEAIQTNRLTVTTEAGKNVDVRSTNLLLGESIAPTVRMIGGKTGSLPEAGYCFVGFFRKNDHDIITVVLGAADDEHRFLETKNLVRWAYEAYTW